MQYLKKYKILYNKQITLLYIRYFTRCITLHCTHYIIMTFAKKFALQYLFYNNFDLIFNEMRKLESLTLASCIINLSSSYLIGSPKNWLAIPTVAPVMQMTKLNL